MVKEHLNYLKKISHNDKEYIGNNSLLWTKSVFKKKVLF